MKNDFPIHRPAIYNPALWSREEVKTYFIARHTTLDRIVDDLRREKLDTKPQHRLILGQRGMGKSTLLRRIAIEVEDDSELNALWLPLTFPEEQYNVASLADFWLNCLDALSDFLEGSGDEKMAADIDTKVETLDRQNADGVLKALLQVAKRMNRRLLLLVDNVDLIFDRLKKEDWVLRETLQEHREIMLVGASARALEASYNYGAAFYDFFKIDELRGLSLAEMRGTILALARMRGAVDVIRKIEKDPVRLQVLHTLTGGNPRTTVLLYGVLLKGVVGNVRTDLEGLLDEVTPLYKARFEELPSLSQQVLDKLALYWDPMTARQLADALAMDVNLTSSQLARLVEIGVVEKVKAGRGKRTAFQVGERFFNIWYLMRASRRVRRKLVWLVEFLRMFYSTDERKHIARTCLDAKSADSREAEYQLALARTLPMESIGRALETSALEILLAHGVPVKLEDILDVSGEDKDLMPRAVRIRLLQEVRKKLQIVLPEAGVSFSVETFIEQNLGFPTPFESKRSLMESLLKSTRFSIETWNELNVNAEMGWDKLSRKYGIDIAVKLRAAHAHGDMNGIGDIEGGAAAAERYECPVLELLPKLIEAQRDTMSLEPAELLAENIIDLGANGSFYWQCLGDAIWGDLDQLNEAEEAYRKALELDPQEVGVWRRLVAILPLMENRKAEAEYALNKWMELNPQDPISWTSAAMYYHLFHEDEVEVERLLQKAMGIPDKTSGGLMYITNTLFTMHKIARAMKHCRELLEKCSDEFVVENFEAFLYMFECGLKAGAGSQLLALFDETEAGQRWRPIREALAAAVEGNAELLNGVAPEVRHPALEILRVIAPQLLLPVPNKDGRAEV